MGVAAEVAAGGTGEQTLRDANKNFWLNHCEWEWWYWVTAFIDFIDRTWLDWLEPYLLHYALSSSENSVDTTTTGSTPPDEKQQAAANAAALADLKEIHGVNDAEEDVWNDAEGSGELFYYAEDDGSFTISMASFDADDGEEQAVGEAEK